MNGSRQRVLAIIILATLAVACAGAGEPSPSANLSDYQRQLEELAELRAARESALAEMSVADLAQALAEDSGRGLEPWNSLAVKEVERRGSEIAPELAQELEARDRSSFLGLMALRSIDREAYAALGPEQRVAILADALATAEFFNAFGLPHLYWEDPARAIIEEGPDAEGALLPLLDDTRPAPMWGQEEVVEFESYQYRVADYALALILAIQGREEPLPSDPRLRDEMIEQLFR